MPALRRCKRSARVQHDVGRAFHRIVPTEIFQIDKSQRSILAAQAVVKSEVRGHQTSPFLRQIGCKIKASSLNLRPCNVGLALENRNELVRQEDCQCSLAAAALKACQTAPDLPLNLG